MTSMEAATTTRRRTHSVRFGERSILIPEMGPVKPHLGTRKFSVPLTLRSRPSPDLYLDPTFIPAPPPTTLKISLPSFTRAPKRRSNSTGELLNLRSCLVQRAREDGRLDLRHEDLPDVWAVSPPGTPDGLVSPGSTTSSSYGPSGSEYFPSPTTKYPKPTSPKTQSFTPSFATKNPFSKPYTHPPPKRSSSVSSQSSSFSLTRRISQTLHPGRITEDAEPTPPATHHALQRAVSRIQDVDANGVPLPTEPLAVCCKQCQKGADLGQQPEGEWSIEFSRSAQLKRERDEKERLQQEAMKNGTPLSPSSAGAALGEIREGEEEDEDAEIASLGSKKGMIVDEVDIARRLRGDSNVLAESTDDDTVTETEEDDSEGEGDDDFKACKWSCPLSTSSPRGAKPLEEVNEEEKRGRKVSGGGGSGTSTPTGTGTVTPIGNGVAGSPANGGIWLTTRPSPSSSPRGSPISTPKRIPSTTSLTDLSALPASLDRLTSRRSPSPTSSSRLSTPPVVRQPSPLSQQPPSSYTRAAGTPTKQQQQPPKLKRSGSDVGQGTAVSKAKKKGGLGWFGSRVIGSTFGVA